MRTCDQIKSNQTGHVLVCVAINPKRRAFLAQGEAFLNFTVSEVGAENYEDEYQLENVSLNPFLLTFS